MARFLSGLFVLTILFLAVSSAGFAQGTTPRPVSAQQRAAIIDSAARIFTDVYTFPDVGKKMADLLRKQQKQHAYDTIATLQDFTRKLTDDLRSISHDKHVSVRPIMPQDSAVASADSATARAHQLEQARYENFEFQKIEHLPGNIGYIKFNQFYDASIAGSTAIAAMNFVGNCDALIFDVRDNGGGDASLVQLITGYLFDDSRLLNTFEIRGQERRDQYWSNAYVPGPHISQIPVYVLTSPNTFSCAEEFAYDLQTQKRGTIVGETSGGGANPNRFVRIPSLGVNISVPYGRAVNPITGTNWEGVGVKPDIACPASDALEVAELEALKILQNKQTNPQRQAELSWRAEELNAKLHPVQLATDELKVYAGNYGPRIVSFENGELYYQRGQNPKRRLIPMSKNLFAVDGVNYFRVEFIADASGSVKELVGHYDNGTTDRNTRNN